MKPITSPYLNLLRNHIDITHVPFSDRGSRLLVFQEPDQGWLLVKLAERLTTLQPDIEAYLRRPPFIRNLCLVDGEGEALDFEVETSPQILYFRTRLGDFGLTFQDNQTMAFGLPPQVAAGLRFHVSPQFWEKTEQGGMFKAVRNLTYDSNGETVHNQITPEAGGYSVEFIVQAGDDCAITLTVGAAQAYTPKYCPFPPRAQRPRRAGVNGLAVYHRSLSLTVAPMPMPGGSWPTTLSAHMGRWPTKP